VRPRSVIVAVLLVALATAAAGCQESGFDESKETARPLKVQHALGESKVPGQAEEPLTLTVDTLDDTLALDVRPSRAAVPRAELPAYLRKTGHGVALMRPVTSADLPAAKAVRPDLILGSAEGQGKLYDELSRIAPTVMSEGGGGQWKLNLRLVGEALGRTNDAERLLIDYDREAAKVRASLRHAHPQDRELPTTRVAVVRTTADGLRFARRDSFAGTILADAGVAQAHSLAGADAILLSSAPGAAHLDGSFTRVDGQLWWGAGGALAARAALAELQDALAR
jgi:iron complex transport system substrate-binding protein